MNSLHSCRAIRRMVALTAGILLTFSCSPRQDSGFEKNMEWWKDARYGMFVHWGISSLEGFEISWARDSYGPQKYDSLALRFNPSEFDADAWIDVAEQAGMKYIVLTAKHHDGFCLWDTESSTHNIMNTPYGKDVCRQLADAAHRRGMHLGWYFSTRQWNDPDCSDPERTGIYVEKMKMQLRELLTNYGKVDLLWFDYDGYPCPTDPREIFSYVLELAPDIVINNRLYPLTGHESHAYVGECGMYATPEQFVGGYGVVPWETNSTTASSRQWSIRYNDPPRPSEDMAWELIGAAGGNGNFLMNVGPDSLGVIPPDYAMRLKEVGDWIRAHEGILYGTTCGPWKPGSNYVSTQKDGSAYLVLREGGSITLPYSEDLKIAKAQIDGKNIEYSVADGKITFSVPEEYSGVRNLAIRLSGVSVPEGFEPLAPFCTSGSVTYGKPITASSSISDVYMHCPSAANDDNPQTIWRPGRVKGLDEIDAYGTIIRFTDPDNGQFFSRDATLEVDLLDETEVSSVKVMSAGWVNIGEVKVERLEGSDWVTVAATSNLTSDWECSFAPQTAQRWRLVIKEGDYDFGIREFQLLKD